MNQTISTLSYSWYVCQHTDCDSRHSVLNVKFMAFHLQYPHSVEFMLMCLTFEIFFIDWVHVAGYNHKNDKNGYAVDQYEISHKIVLQSPLRLASGIWKINSNMTQPSNTVSNHALNLQYIFYPGWRQVSNKSPPTKKINGIWNTDSLVWAQNT